MFRKLQQQQQVKETERRGETRLVVETEIERERREDNGIINYQRRGYGPRC